MNWAKETGEIRALKIDAGLMTARDLINFAQPMMAKRFKDVGQIGPMYHAITESGVHFVFPAPFVRDKDTSVDMVRAFFRQERVVAYIFMDEAWALLGEGITQEDIAFCNREGVHAHPKRAEIITFIAEDDQCTITGYQRIIRPPKGKAKLGELTILPEDAEGYGRMVKLLPDLNAKPN